MPRTERLRFCKLPMCIVSCISTMSFSGKMKKLYSEERGGYAHLSTALKKLKAENPENTLVMDTGDMFQGSMLAVRTEGDAFIPILNAMNYDLYHPGNWEVVYYKDQMQHLLGGLKAPKVCTNIVSRFGRG